MRLSEIMRYCGRLLIFSFLLRIWISFWFIMVGLRLMGSLRLFWWNGVLRWIGMFFCLIKFCLFVSVGEIFMILRIL